MNWRKAVGNVGAIHQVTSRFSHGGTENNYEDAHIRAKIRTRYLPNKHSELHHLS
jgi:hypothetical protein